MVQAHFVEEASGTMGDGDLKLNMPHKRNFFYKILHLSPQSSYAEKLNNIDCPRRWSARY